MTIEYKDSGYQINARLVCEVHGEFAAKIGVSQIQDQMAAHRQNNNCTASIDVSIVPKTPSPTITT